VRGHGVSEAGLGFSRRWSKPVFASACWVAYAVGYVLAYWIFGTAAAILATLPVCAVATLFGRRAGLLAGLLGFPVSSLLTYLAEADWQPLDPAHLLPGVPLSVVLITLGLILGRLHDLAETSRNQAETLHHQALHDFLTGLPNRAWLERELEHAIEAARHGQGSVCLLLMDLDNFKEVNDTVGHHGGDALLKEVSGRLRSELRQSDTVARLGGDEFAFVVPQTDSRGAMEVVRKILKSLEHPFLIEGRLFNVGGSVGFAMYPMHGQDAETLLRGADAAMYIAKRAGSGYATPEVEEDEAASGQALLNELRRAVAQRELVLHYQPQVDLASGRPVGMEALVRWDHPQRGLVPPSEFIHVCERSGLIRPLTDWVIETAVRQCATWQAAGLRVPVVINLTLQNLTDASLPRTLKAALDACALEPKMVAFEVTEGTLTKEPDAVAATLEKLRKLGAKLIIDDFGTGYSSLACLHQTHVDAIKLDRSFVARMASDPGVAGIVGSLVRISHDLDCGVIAEGVEDRETFDLLDTLSCDAAQGFYVSAPIPSRWVNAWLERACAASLTRRARRQLQDSSVDATVPLQVIELNTAATEVAAV
jgi:diguanylate cyclase (GGDEF)-like protein